MSLFRKNKTGSKNEIVPAKNDALPDQIDFESEYGLKIKPCDSLDLSNPDKYLVIKDGATKLSPLVAQIPNQVTNSINYNTLSQNMYSVTFNGRAVLPGELYQKKNGSYISNLKSGNSWGSQTDMQLVDTSQAQLANVANAAFGLASVATSTYYLKNIDEKLHEVVENTQSIQDFLEDDKQSRIQSDYEVLQGIISTINIIRVNPDLKAMKLNQIGRIQDEQRSNIKFYEAEIIKLLQKYAVEKKKKASVDKLAESIRRNYCYYQISMETYSISRMLEIQLTEEFDLNYLKSVKYEFKHNNDTFIQLHDKILDDVFAAGLSRISSKVGLKTSDVLERIGDSLEGKSIGSIELDKPFNEGSLNLFQSVRRKSLKDAYRILDEKTFNVHGVESASSVEDNNIMNPYVNIMESMESTFENPMTLISDGKDLYLEISTKEKDDNIDVA